MTREEYFEIKDDCVKNGRVKVITAEDTKESLRKFFDEYNEKYLLLTRMTGDEWLLDFTFDTYQKTGKVAILNPKDGEFLTSFGMKTAVNTMAHVGGVLIMRYLHSCVERNTRK